MKKQTLKDVAVQKSLMLSEKEAMKVLIFMAGMEAERFIDNKSECTEQSRSFRSTGLVFKPPQT